MPTPSFQDLVALATQYKESAIFNYALSTNLFDLLCHAHDAAAIAGERHWDERKTRILLNALTAMGLLRLEGERYFVATDLDVILGSSDQQSLRGVAQMELAQWCKWRDLDAALAIGGGPEHYQETVFAHSPAQAAAFYAAMRAFALQNCAWIAALPVFESVRVIADLCGGHGTYLCEILKTHSHLTGSVWDLAHSRREAEKTFEEYALGERASYVCKNLMDEPVFDSASFDCALLFDCLHYFPKEIVARILRGLHDALPIGGYTLLLTQSLNADGCSPRSASVFSFDMLMNTEFGELHALEWLEREMVRIGFVITHREPSSTYLFELVVAQKK